MDLTKSGINQEVSLRRRGAEISSEIYPAFKFPHHLVWAAGIGKIIAYVRHKYS
jgi:hypothetical protein